jgi:hypothetical protein
VYAIGALSRYPNWFGITSALSEVRLVSKPSTPTPKYHESTRDDCDRMELFGLCLPQDGLNYKLAAINQSSIISSQQHEIAAVVYLLPGNSVPICSQGGGILILSSVYFKQSDRSGVASLIDRESTTL